MWLFLFIFIFTKSVLRQDIWHSYQTSLSLDNISKTTLFPHNLAAGDFPPFSSYLSVIFQSPKAATASTANTIIFCGHSWLLAQLWLHLGTIIGSSRLNPGAGKSLNLN